SRCSIIQNANTLETGCCRPSSSKNSKSGSNKASRKLGAIQFGDIPERLQFYIDYDAIARDLEVDYSEAVVANSRVIYRCG
ncbi:MAG: antirestriction protein ArdA, partial [Rhodobacteraceae bacterium]|nr:antirestriction protein ArdA [Paracoccaceae bacterium]